MSLPGGATEPGESYEQTALREAHEEIGLAPDGVRTLGSLTPVDIHVSGFRLHPIVGATDRRPSLLAADGEVARILDIRVAELCDPSRLSSISLSREGRTVVAPSFRVADVDIWGATAMVLAEFLVLLGWHAERKRGRGSVPES